MDVKVKKLPKSEVEIVVELTQDEFQMHINKAAEEVSKEVKISGFRPGKVPYDVLLQHVGKDVIHSHAMDMAIPTVLTDVIRTEKLEIIVRPKVEVISMEPFKFKAVAPVYPEVKVDGYDKVKVKTDDVKVDDKDVDETLANLQKQFTEWTVVDRGVKKGDKVELDFEGFDEGGAFLEGTRSMNHPLIVGDNMMIPGFEENIEGMKKGEEKEFTLAFPKDYHKKSFQSKKVKFKVKLNKIEEPVLPEMNEEFVEKLTGKKDSVENFRKRVSEDLLSYKKSEDRKLKEQELLEKFLALTKVDVSEMLIDEEVNFMLREMRADMNARGLQFEAYLEQIKKTEDELREELKKEAEKRIKIRFGIHEIMEQEKIEAKDNEVEEAMKTIPQENVNTHDLRGRIVNSIRISHLFDRFLQR